MKKLLILPLLVTSLAGCGGNEPGFDFKEVLKSVANEFAIIGQIDQSIYFDAEKTMLKESSEATIYQYTNMNWGEQEYYSYETGNTDYNGITYHFLGNEQGYAAQISLLPDNTVGLLSTGYDFATTFTALDFLLSDDVGYELIDNTTLKVVLGAHSEAAENLFFALTGYDGLGAVGKAYITFNEDHTLKGISFENEIVGAYCFVNKYEGLFATRDDMVNIDKEVETIDPKLTASQASRLQKAFDAINGMNYTLEIVDGNLDDNYKYNGEYYCNYNINVSHQGMVYTDLSINSSDYYLNVENEGLYGVVVDETTNPVTLKSMSENPLSLLETFLITVGFSTDLFTYKGNYNGKDKYHLDLLLDFAPTYLVPSAPFYNGSLWINDYGIDITLKTDSEGNVEEIEFYSIYLDEKDIKSAITCRVKNIGTTSFPYENYTFKEYVRPTSWKEYEEEHGSPYMDDALTLFPDFESVIPFYYSSAIVFSVSINDTFIEENYIAITYYSSTYEEFNSHQEVLFALWEEYGWSFTILDEDNPNILAGVHESSGTTCEVDLTNFLAYNMGASISFVVFPPLN